MTVIIVLKIKSEFCVAHCFLSPFLLSSLNHCPCSVVLGVPGAKEKVGSKILVFLDIRVHIREKGEKQ